MMRTFPPTLRSSPAVRRSQDGFLLIEVIVSSLLVAVVVIATLSGFDVVNRATAEERRHGQAAVLAAQSQEQLRSDPASALYSLIGGGHERVYARVLGGTTYTITQEVKNLGGSGAGISCSPKEKKAATAANIEVISKVTWPTLRKTAQVTHYSVITPPVGSALEVDVLNGRTPEEGVAGVTARVKYTPEKGGAVTLEGTTGEAGCVLFGGIQATLATVEILEKENYVTPTGALKWQPKEITIAPNITTHYPVEYNEGGKITATFNYKGGTIWKGETVKGDTFTVFNTKLNQLPSFEVGSSGESPLKPFEYEVGGEQRYKAVTHQYATTATTPGGAEVKYSKGDLFPFSTPLWSVYAGDCPKNNVSAEDEASASVPVGGTATVIVPLSLVRVNVLTGKKGSKAEEGSPENSPYPVTVTDSECTSEPVPNNASAANLIHEQKTKESHLEYPFQPFGTGILCLAYNNGGTHRKFTYKYKLTKANGAYIPVFLAESSIPTEKLEEIVNESGETIPIGITITKSTSSTVTCP